MFLSHNACKVSEILFYSIFGAILTYKIFLAVDESTHRETILDAEGPISEILPRKYHRFASKSILKSLYVKMRGMQTISENEQTQLTSLLLFVIKRRVYTKR